MVSLVYSTVLDNIAPVGANVGATRLLSFGSLIGPAKTDPLGGQVQPTATNCRADDATSYGYNVVADASCGLTAGTDLVDGAGGQLGPLAANGGFGETRLPPSTSVVVDRIPLAACAFVPPGRYLEGEQHLARFGIDPVAPVRVDQRGVPRTQERGCDAGAVEVSPVSPVVGGVR